jgi:membrane protein
MSRRPNSKAAARPPGRYADSPWKLPRAAWRQVAARTWREAGEDNIGLVAAGVAFYGFLALVPLLAALVLAYGFVADPARVIDDMNELTALLPADVAQLIGEQLMAVVTSSAETKGAGLLIALIIALFGARNGAAAIVTALNIVYEETETRSLLRTNLLNLLITAAAIALAMLSLYAVTALGHLERLFPGAPDWLLLLGTIGAYPLLVLTGAAGAATLYRYAPDRAKARWVWLTPGSIGAASCWLILTVGFGLYVTRFGDYGATYGSLSAVVVLLTWLYLSSYVLLLGAELNSELEHQTARDSTDGVPRPRGRRGAWVADHVAGEDDAGKDAKRASPLSDARKGKPAARSRVRGKQSD